MSAVSSGRASAVELWVDRDPSVYWPPWPIHQPFSGKRALVHMRDGSTVVAELPLAEMEVRPTPQRLWRLSDGRHPQRVATSKLVASTTVPVSFHQPPGREGYTATDLGLIAIGGAHRLSLSRRAPCVLTPSQAGCSSSCPSIWG